MDPDVQPNVGPIAGVIAAVSAHRLGYQWEALGLRGTGLSALFLLPWLHLMIDLYGFKVPKILPSTAYVAFHCGFWIYGSIFTSWWFSATILSLAFPPPIGIVMLVIPFANTLSLFYFLRSLWQAQYADREQGNNTGLSQTLRIPFIVTAVIQVPGILFEVIQAIS